MLTYLGYFSTSFITAGVLWPIISAVLTLPILAGLYHRHHRMRLTSAAAAYLTVLYVVGLIAFTLYPMPDDPEAFCAAHDGGYAPQLNPLRFIEDVQATGINGVMQLAMNVVFFIPLGFVFARWLRWHWWAVLCGGFAVSLLIECTQLSGFWGLYPCAYRQFDVNDLMTNTLGALVGWAAAMLFGRWVPVSAAPERDEVNLRPGALHRAVAFIIDIIFVMLVYAPITMVVSFLFYWIAEPLRNGDFALFGGAVTLGSDWMNAVAPIAAALAFLIFEVWVPATHRGQTLGSMYTHMSLETVTRKGGLRVMFYAVRTLVLGTLTVVAIVGFANGSSALRYAIYGFAALFVFELILRRAPWDFIPE